jgi:hypothetical protein
MRTMTEGVLSERDRLFEYTVGEFFQELSLFITETENKNKAIEKALKKK